MSLTARDLTARDLTVRDLTACGPAAMPADVRAAVGGLTPVGLPTLVEGAELQVRIDRKYLLPPLAFERLVRRLQDRVGVLQVAGEREFSYESVYFDTPDLVSYHATARRRPQRFKVRTRTYLDSQTSVTELKRRGRRGETVKHRLPFPPGEPGDRYRLSPEARSFLLGHGLPGSLVVHLAPVLVTRYRRITLVDFAAGHRITCDAALNWIIPVGFARDGKASGDSTGEASGESAGQTGGRVLALDSLVLVETKSPGPATVADRLLWRDGHRPLPLSKFGVGLAAMMSGLPRNVWHRTLLRHFAESTKGVAARRTDS